MANPFRAVVDGRPSDSMARPLELLLSSVGSIVTVEGFQAEQDARWATHAVPVFSSTLFAAGQ